MNIAEYRDFMAHSMATKMADSTDVQEIEEDLKILIAAASANLLSEILKLDSPADVKVLVEEVKDLIHESVMIVRHVDTVSITV